MNTVFMHRALFWHRASFWQPLQPWFVKETAFFFAKAQNLRIRLVPNSWDSYAGFLWHRACIYRNTELLFTGTQSFCIRVPVFPTARYHREIPLSPYAAFATCIFQVRLYKSCRSRLSCPAKYTLRDGFFFRYSKYAFF